MWQRISQRVGSIFQPVINYDSAKNWETYLHRVGRTTSRETQVPVPKGLAFSLLVQGNPQDAWMAAMLTEAFKKNNFDPPSDLVQLALTHEPFRTAQVSGRNFFDESRSGKKAKKASFDSPFEGATGILLQKTRGITSSISNVPIHFVRESKTNQNESISTSKRRWDAPGTSTSNNSSMHRYSDSTLSATTSSAALDGTSNGYNECSETHVSCNKAVKKAKIFKATDEIPSSDDENDPPVTAKTSEPSLLKLRTSRSIALKIAESVRAGSISGKVSRWG